MFHSTFHGSFFIDSGIPVLIPVLQIRVGAEYPASVSKRSVEGERAQSPPIPVQIEWSRSPYPRFAIIRHLIGYAINRVFNQSGGNHIPLTFHIVGIEIQRKCIYIRRFQRRITHPDVQRIGTICHRLQITYIGLATLSPIYYLQTGALGELITEIDGRREIKNRSFQLIFRIIFQYGMAHRLLRFKVGTYIIVIFLSGSANRNIKQVIAILIFETVACLFIIIGSKFVQILIPIVNEMIGIIRPILITVTELKKMQPR